MQLIKLIISYYLINIARGSPKTSAETGNDIEKFLMEGDSVKELSPKNKEAAAANKKPDKFMEDLIEVQRTYRNLKEKWQRMMEEKKQVIQMANSSTPSTLPVATSSESSEIQEIDVDVFEAPDKFQDISSADQKTEFDDEAFVDISVTSPSTSSPTTAKSHVANELDEIQAAIREAFGGSKEQKIMQPSLFEIIGPTTKKAVQMDALVTTVKVDQTTPRPSGPLGNHGPQIVPHDPVPKSLLSTFGLHQVPPFPKAATPWRRKLQNPELEDVDPFEDPTIATSSEVPTTTPTTTPTPTTTTTTKTTTTATPIPTTTTPTPTTTTTSTSPPPTTSSTAVPHHILPTSSFVSSGAHPDALPATNLFRYPDHVDIPFFGAKSQDLEEEVTTSAPMRPTTPEPFRDEEIQNSDDVEEKKEEVEASLDDVDTESSDDLGSSDDMESSDDVETSDDLENTDTEEITASEDLKTTTPRGIENNDDYVEENFSQEATSSDSNSESQVPDSFGIGKAPEEPSLVPLASNFDAQNLENSESIFGSPPGSFVSKPRPKAFGTVPSSSGPTESEFDVFGSPPGSSEGLVGSFGSPHGPAEPQGPFGGSFDSAPSESFGPSGELKENGLFGSPPGPSKPLGGSMGSFGSPRGPAESQGSGPSGPSGQLEENGLFGSPPGLSESSMPSRPSGPPLPAFGIGRSPPGFTEHIGPTMPPALNPQKPGVSDRFPTLVEQVDNFFNEEDTLDSGASSSLGSFGSAEQVVSNVPVAQNIQVLDDPKPRIPTHMPISRNQKEPIGIFGTKLKAINQKAYKPPMFPSALSSETVQMVQLGNPYLQRTTVPPIGPHGLVEPKMEVNSVNLELPAWGEQKDNGIMNKARREYQNEFEQQIRDVRMIDDEINKISKLNDDGRLKNAQRCSQVYAHTLSLPQIQKMSHSLGLGDVATVIQKASDLTEHQENDIAQLEVDLEEKRKLIAKVEILLSLSESRALLFDLLNEQKKIAEKMENHALDLLQKTNLRQQTPSPFSAASDLSELSTAVRQVLHSKSAISKKGWSMMKRKLHKKNNIPNEKFELIDTSDVKIRNSFIEFNKKAGHLQETAEIVEPVLSVPYVSQNDQFGRQPVAVSVHRRPLPLAPPTMSPKVFSRPSHPSQHAAHHLTASKPLSPPGSDDESDTVHELIDMLHEDIVKLRASQKEIRLAESRPAEVEEQICRQVQCDFEKADLCNFESSHDETTRMRLSKSRQLRQKRSSALSQITDDLLAEPSNIADDLLPYTFRAWSIWAGRRADRQKQIDIGPDFSPRNLHFAAVFLENQQAGILSIPLILSPTSTKIRLRLFEGTRGIRLRICCDRYCPLETEQGLYRGHRKWLRKTVTCPPNTQTLSFECLNDGPDRGACGIDEIFVDSTRCHHFFDGSDQN